MVRAGSALHCVVCIAHALSFEECCIHHRYSGTAHVTLALVVHYVSVNVHVHVKVFGITWGLTVGLKKGGIIMINWFGTGDEGFLFHLQLHMTIY